MKHTPRLLGLFLPLSLFLTMCAPAPAVTPSSFRARTPSATRIPASTPTVPPASPTPTVEPASPATAVPALDLSQLKSRLDSVVPQAIADGGGSACSLAIAYPDSSGALRADFFNYGTLSKKNSVSVNAETEYEIGSLTKLLTGDVLAQLVKDGQLSLDDPIENYLPGGTWVPVYQGRPIAVRHLATHTSGLPRDVARSGDVTEVNGVDVLGYATEAQMLGFLNTYQLLVAPGATWEYSNYAYGLLGLIESRVGMKAYGKLVAQQVLQPLDLPDTAISLAPDQAARLAAAYTADGADAPSFAVTGDMLSAGGFRSTARDMAAYLIANMQPDKSRLSSIIQMTLAKQGLGPTPGGASGLGWLISDEGALRQQDYKTGATAGYNAYIAFWPAQDVGYVLLCNGHPVSKLAPQLDQALGEAASPIDTGD
jgi:D-alanyl-D-alanine-carboxypeptidase/D-alanyl-D-alanine-endopeptidase